MTGGAPNDPRAAEQELDQHLSQIAALAGSHERRKTVRAHVGSELDADGKLTGSLELSSLASYSITFAVDNLVGLRDLMQSGNPLRPFAPYPLLRAALEGVSQAIWLLGPENQRERVQRLLQARNEESDQDLQLTRLWTERRDDDAAALRKSKATALQSEVGRRRRLVADARSVAIAAGISQDEWLASPGGWGAIVSEAGAIALGTGKGFVATSLWRFVSGVTHPSASRGATASLLTDQGGPTTGGPNILGTLDVAWLNRTLVIVIALLLRAEDLLRVRKVTPAT